MPIHSCPFIPPSPLAPHPIYFILPPSFFISNYDTIFITHRSKLPTFILVCHSFPEPFLVSLKIVCKDLPISNHFSFTAFLTTLLASVLAFKYSSLAFDVSFLNHTTYTTFFFSLLLSPYILFYHFLLFCWPFDRILSLLEKHACQILRPNTSNSMNIYVMIPLD